MTDELITPITQMHVHGIEFEKKLGYNTHILKIKMLILSHFGTPLPPNKNAPPGHSRICPCLVHTIPLQHYYY